MEPTEILYILIFILSLDFIIDKVLDFVNINSQADTLPQSLEGIYDDKEYKKSLDYTRTQTKFSFLSSTFSFVLSLILILSGAFGWLDEWLRQFVSNPIFLAMAFFGILFIASDILTTPFQLYHTFGIEEKFGFNKTTIKTFITDKLKGYIMSILLGGAILWILLSLINWLGKDFWIYFWVVSALIMVFLNMFYTTLIVPIFNKLVPLDDGELKDAINDYSKKIDFPIDNIFVIDGSKRSNKANAFFSGFGKKKKIVLYDTLINNHSVDELVAVLAHEVGHYKKKHIVSSMVLSVLQIGLMLFVMSQMIFNKELSLALGAKQMGVHLNLLVFAILYSPISSVIGLGMNVFSRKNEFEADAYATETFGGAHLKNALKKLSVNNLSNLIPHSWYVFYHYSHPPLLQRLKAIDSISKAK